MDNRNMLIKKLIKKSEFVDKYTWVLGSDSGRSVFVQSTSKSLGKALSAGYDCYYISPDVFTGDFHFENVRFEEKTDGLSVDVTFKFQLFPETAGFADWVKENVCQELTVADFIEKIKEAKYGLQSFLQECLAGATSFDLLQKYGKDAVPVYVGQSSHVEPWLHIAGMQWIQVDDVPACERQKLAEFNKLQAAHANELKTLREKIAFEVSKVGIEDALKVAQCNQRLAEVQRQLKIKRCEADIAGANADKAEAELRELQAIKAREGLSAQQFDRMSDLQGSIAKYYEELKWRDSRIEELEGTVKGLTKKIKSLIDRDWYDELSVWGKVIRHIRAISAVPFFMAGWICCCAGFGMTNLESKRVFAHLSSTGQWFAFVEALIFWLLAFILNGQTVRRSIEEIRFWWIELFKGKLRIDLPMIICGFFRVFAASYLVFLGVFAVMWIPYLLIWAFLYEFQIEFFTGVVVICLSASGLGIGAYALGARLLMKRRIRASSTTGRKWVMIIFIPLLFLAFYDERATRNVDDLGVKISERFLSEEERSIKKAIKAYDNKDYVTWWELVENVNKNDQRIIGRLGHAYHLGCGIKEPDCRKAIEQYEKLLKRAIFSDEKEADIEYRIGLCCHELGEYNKAFACFNDAVKKGNLEASLYLGQYYEFGLCESGLDFKTAEKCFRKALKSDNAKIRKKAQEYVDRVRDKIEKLSKLKSTLGAGDLQKRVKEKIDKTKRQPSASKCKAGINRDTEKREIAWSCIEHKDGSVSLSASAVSTNITGSLVIPSILAGREVKGIGGRAFTNCDLLKSIIISDGIKSVDEGAFIGSRSLESVIIPSSVTNIGDYAFMSCRSLKTIVIPDKIKTVGQGIFEKCTSLESVTIPSSVTNIGVASFRNCSNLVSVELPLGVKSIGFSAFAGCTSLTSVTIPSSVTTIEGHAFSGCERLSSLRIPSSVALIGGGAFTGCGALKSFVVDAGNPLYCMKDGMLLTKDGKSLLAYPIQNKTSVAIPEGVQRIRGHAFADSKSLVSVIIPSSVTQIGQMAFGDCKSLKTVEFLGDKPSADSRAFYNVPVDCKIRIPRDNESWRDVGEKWMGMNVNRRFVVDAKTTIRMLKAMLDWEIHHNFTKKKHKFGEQMQAELWNKVKRFYPGVMDNLKNAPLRERCDAAILLAAFSCKGSISYILDEKILDVNEVGDGGFLHLAAAAGDKEMIDFLIAKGAEVDKKDKDGQSPISWAGMSPDQLGTMKYLIERYGAKITNVNDDESLFMDVLRRGNCVDVIKYLVEERSYVPTSEELSEIHSDSYVLGKNKELKAYIESKPWTISAKQTTAELEKDAHNAFVAKDWKTGFDIATNLTMNGISDSYVSYHVGYCYSPTYGIDYPEEKDFEKAYKWFRRTAELEERSGDGIAECILGDMELHGQGCAVNTNNAAAWYRRSAERKYSRGCYELGRCYEENIVAGASDNLAAATNWYFKAMSLEYGPATNAYERVLERIKPSSKVVDYVLKTAGRGDWTYFKMSISSAGNLNVVPKDLVVLLDATGSMGSDRIRSCCRHIKEMLKSCVNESDRVNVGVFRSRCDFLFESCRPYTQDTSNQIDARLGKVVSYGRGGFSTRLISTLKAEGKRPLVVLVVTDDLENIEASDVQSLDKKEASVYFYAIKSQTNNGYIKALSRCNHGDYCINDSLRRFCGAKIVEFCKQFSSPVLTDIGVLVEPESKAEIAPFFSRNLCLDGAVELIGRVPKGSSKIEFTLKGANGSTMIEQKFTPAIGSSIQNENIVAEWDEQMKIFSFVEQHGSKVSSSLHAEDFAISGKRIAFVDKTYNGATEDYTVKRGDTFGGIAIGHGISIRQLMMLNNFTNCVLRNGMILKVPVTKIVRKDSAEYSKPIGANTKAESHDDIAKAFVKAFIDGDIDSLSRLMFDWELHKESVKRELQILGDKYKSKKIEVRIDRWGRGDRRFAKEKAGETAEAYDTSLWENGERLTGGPDVVVKLVDGKLKASIVDLQRWER